jgi:hypothetical protein
VSLVGGLLCGVESDVEQEATIDAKGSLHQVVVSSSSLRTGKIIGIKELPCSENINRLRHQVHDLFHYLSFRTLGTQRWNLLVADPVDVIARSTVVQTFLFHSP